MLGSANGLDAASGALLGVFCRLKEAELEPVTFVSLERPQ